MSRLSRQQGFTLVELLISMTILTIALLGAYAEYLHQLQANTKLDSQSMLRKILGQAMAFVYNTPEMFPKGVDSAGKPLVYVVCLNATGGPMANVLASSGSTNYVVVFTGLTNAGFRQQLSASNGGTEICAVPAGAGGFEVHVSWTPGDFTPISLRDTAQVNVIDIKAPNPTVTTKPITMLEGNVFM